MKCEDVPRFIYALQSQIDELHKGVIENSELLNLRMDKLEQNQVELDDEIESIMLRLYALDKHINEPKDTNWSDSVTYNPVDDLLKVMRGDL